MPDVKFARDRLSVSKIWVLLLRQTVPALTLTRGDKLTVPDAILTVEQVSGGCAAKLLVGLLYSNDLI